MSRVPVVPSPPGVRLAAVLVGIAAVLAVGTAPPREPVRAATTTPVEGVTLLCPAVRQDDTDGTTTTVTVGSAPTAAVVPAGAGSTVGSALLSASGPLVALPLQASGQVVTGLGGAATDDALLLRARGGLAAGLQAEQLTRSTGGARRGLEALACGAARSDTWFAGGSQGAGDSSTLLLVNPDDAPAVVDVDAWSVEGPVDARPARGLVVAARSRLVVPLDTLAPDRTGLALHVVAARGRVAAALEHVRGSAGAPGGADWVPAAPPPSPRVVVPGLPAGPGQRSLLVTNPGPDQAVVAVQLSSGEGQFVPAGLAAVAVPAGSTVSIDLTAQLATAPAAVTVTSDAAPVLAVGLVVDGQGVAQDLAYAGAAAAVDGGGSALIPDASGPGAVLLLSATGGDATVLVTPVPLAGPPGAGPEQAGAAPGQAVAVPGGSTVAVPLSGLRRPDGGLAVQVRPTGGGPVYAAVLLREDLPTGPLTALLPVTSAPRTVARPAVQGDPAAALPPRR